MNPSPPRPSNWPVYLPDPTAHDWPEDAADADNGCYWHCCCGCGTDFVGNKRRPAVCHVCHDADDAETKRRAEWLHDHGAPSDWVVWTSGEVAQMKADLLRLVWNESELKRALEDISTTAHCLAKAGPLNTPTLAAAWVRFMEIDAMASSALAKARQGEIVLDKAAQPVQPTPL